MGTFEGHVIPSVIYSVLALWWGFVTSLKYARTLINKNNKYKSTTIMPCFCCPTKRMRTMPIESFVKCTFLSIHAIVEILTGLHYNSEKRLVLEYENSHHVCMLSGFLLSSLVEILMFYGVPFPKGADYAFSGLGFLIQAIIMTTHLDGDNGLEQQVHKLWTIIIVLTFLAGLVEIYKQDAYWPCIIRISFFFTQGTWLMQIAFVVWPHTTNPIFLWSNDHGSHVWLSISLMYHFMGCAVVLMIQYMLVLCMLKCLDRHYSRYEHDLEELEKTSKSKYSVDLHNQHQQRSGNGSKEYSILMNDMDENEDESIDS